MRNVMERIAYLSLFFLLLGCDIQNHIAIRPKVFNSENYGIKIGQITEDEIRSKYKVIAADIGILYLDPKSSNFKNLPIEKAIVYTDKDKIASGFTLIYQKRTIYIKKSTIQNNKELALIKLL